MIVALANTAHINVDITVYDHKYMITTITYEYHKFFVMMCTSKQ